MHFFFVDFFSFGAGGDGEPEPILGGGGGGGGGEKEMLVVDMFVNDEVDGYDRAGTAVGIEVLTELSRTMGHMIGCVTHMYSMPDS